MKCKECGYDTHGVFDTDKAICMDCWEKREN